MVKKIFSLQTYALFALLLMNPSYGALNNLPDTYEQLSKEQQGIVHKYYIGYYYDDVEEDGKNVKKGKINDDIIDKISGISTSGFDLKSVQEAFTVQKLYELYKLIKKQKISEVDGDTVGNDKLHEDMTLFTKAIDEGIELYPQKGDDGGAGFGNNRDSFVAVFKSLQNLEKELDEKLNPASQEPATKNQGGQEEIGGAIAQNSDGSSAQIIQEDKAQNTDGDNKDDKKKKTNQSQPIDEDKSSQENDGGAVSQNTGGDEELDESDTGGDDEDNEQKDDTTSYDKRKVAGIASVVIIVFFMGYYAFFGRRTNSSTKNRAPQS